MKKTLAVLVFSIFSEHVYSADLLLCDFAKANISQGMDVPMISLGKGRVEFDGKTFKATRPNNSFLVSPDLTNLKPGLIAADDKTKVYVASLDKSSFAISDRISKTTEQWTSCQVDQESVNKKKNNDEMTFLESMSPSQGKGYFLTEKHAFTTNCMTWGDVTMITGKTPAMILAGSVNMGSNPRWSGEEYSFTFNGGSMIARFNPAEKRHKLSIQAGDKFYGCGPSQIDHNYD